MPGKSARRVSGRELKHKITKIIRRQNGGGYMSVRLTLLLTVLLVFAGMVSAAEDAPLLLQSPTLSRSDVAFVYGGYLWSVPREGGDARQLTTDGHESSPTYSPDGRWIAFAGEYDGNRDVYVIPAEGGTPHRLTWHPAHDPPVVWTPDSKRVLFFSAPEAYADFPRLYTVPVEGGPADALP